MPARVSLAAYGLPIGLAHRVELRRAVAAGAPLRMSDVALDESEPAVMLRRSLVQSLA
jgi:hypothetical protein